MDNNNEQTVSVSADNAKSLNGINTLKSVAESRLKMLKKTAHSFFSLLTNLVNIIKEKFTKVLLQNKSHNFNPRQNNFGRKHLSRVFLLIIVIGVVGLSIYYIKETAGQSVGTYSDERPIPSQAKAKQTLNKNFAFPLKNDKGEEVSRIEYNIESVELQDTIIVKGQRARAVLGRTFLIINLKISNNHTQGIEINSRDYIRLSVNSQNEWIAPDIHNDPVLVQAISTKYTRLGFPINDTDKDLRLQVGEIKGSKETLNLELKAL